jgi:glycosyltransferase involved in cell wall biosynthesis
VFIRDRMNELARKAEAARHEAAGLERRLAEAEEQASAARTELAAARHEIRALHALREQSAESTNEKALLIEERDWLKAEIGRVQETWMQSERAFSLAQEENELLSQRIALLTADKIALEEQTTALIEERESLHSEMGCLRETFTHSERTLESAQEEAQEQERESEAQVRRIAGLEAQIETLLAREKDLRDMLLEAHDQLLRRDEEIAMHLASALTKTPVAAQAPVAPPNRPGQQKGSRVVQTQPAQGQQPAPPPSAPAPQPAPTPGGKFLQYQGLIGKIRESVRQRIPEGGHVLVVSKGDDDLLRLEPCRGSHFPQREDGIYAGYYPADSNAAITHLKDLQKKKGAQFLLIPQTALWWLDHYRELASYLKEHATTLVDDRESCVLYKLSPAAGETVSAQTPAPETRVEEAAPLPFGVNISGYLTSEKGVGEAVRGQARSLLAAGVPVVLNNLVDDTAANGVEECTSFSRDNPYNVNLIHLNADAILDFVGMRDREFFGNRYNVAFWAWETSRFPEIWWDRFEHLDEIWVGSDFVLDAIARVSPIPVVKTPLAAPVRPTVGPQARSRFNLGKKTFMFLFAFDYMSIFQRKNPLAAVQAFRKAFSSRDDVKLILKCAHSHASPDEARMLAKACHGANIQIIDDVISRQDVNALMNAADCYVSLHRSEGFGLTMAETMSLGKPVIATGYSGNMEFMTPANSYPVKYKLVEIDQAYGPYSDGEWAEPDVDHAAELMRFVFKNREEASAVGKRARADMRRLFSPIAVGERMRQRLLRIAKTGRIAGPVEVSEVHPAEAESKPKSSHSRHKAPRKARR